MHRTRTSLLVLAIALGAILSAAVVGCSSSNAPQASSISEASVASVPVVSSGSVSGGVSRDMIVATTGTVFAIALRETPDSLSTMRYDPTLGRRSIVPSEPGAYSMGICQTQHGAVLLLTMDGISRSDDDGITWRHISDETGWSITASPDGSVLLWRGDYSTSTITVRRSTDEGASWSTIPLAGADNSLSVSVVGLSNGAILLLSQNAVYRSSDLGTSWTTVQTMDRPQVTSQRTTGRVYISTQSGTFYTDDGSSFQQIRLPAGAAGVFIGAGTAIYTTRSVTSTSGEDVELDRSDDGGNLWQPLCQLNTMIVQVVGFAGKLYINSSDGVMLSNDNGTHWTCIGPRALHCFWAQADQTGKLWALSENVSPYHALWSSTDRSTWQYEHDPIDENFWLCGAISPSTGSLAFSGSNQIVMSTNQGATWNRYLTPTMSSFRSLTFSSADILFAVDGTEGTLYRSADYVNWQQITASLPARVSAIAATLNGELYVGSASVVNPEIVRSTDNGATFEHRATITGNFEIVALATLPSGTVLMLGGPVDATTYVNTEQRLYRSTDHGASWGRVQMIGMPSGTDIRSLTTDNNGTLYFSTDQGIFRSAAPM